MMCFNLPQRMINIAKLACVISVVSVAFSSCLQKDVYDPLLIQEIKKKLL